MHYLVRIIVEAESADEANMEADNVMNDLIDQREFDWYHTNTDDSRWPGCWKPSRLSSKAGLAMVKDAMAGQLSEFKQTMETIRLMLDNYSDEQIFNEEFEQVKGHYLSRYQFSVASGYHGNACQLFDTGGCHITSQRDLDRYTVNAKDSWVVQVDCHN